VIRSVLVSSGLLVIAIRADDQAALESACAAVDELLAAPAETRAFGAPPAPRTTASAARRIDATLALVSVPGPYAFAEAMDAKARGDKTRALSALQRLETLYPASPLAESASPSGLRSFAPVRSSLPPT
jgi:hypothetical protein